MILPEPVMWTLNRLDAVQRSHGRCVPALVDASHIEALEDVEYISVRARDGGWAVFVLSDGQKAATAYRREQVCKYTQQKVKQ